MWVCNYTDGLLGKGSFPGMPNQGVRCHYRAFGSTGTLSAPYDEGRTMVHEVGHYLNLNHIWGDDGSLCTGTDNVADTPNQADETYGVPAFPQVSCTNGPNGDMFMNYMDYTDDAGMFMFTAGQSERMDATLHTARTGLLASDGLVPTSGAVNDLWAKDTSDDDGAEPNPSGQPMWVSDDIWVRNDNNGLASQDHQNPEHGSGTTSVYVRVRNRGCSGTASGTVRLYWAKASTGLSWPAPWDGSVTSPALMGGTIGTAPVSVSAGDDEILVFPWAPPDPADYASFGADRGHFCLLARIETGAAPDFGMTFPETGNLYANVQNNNNIVWKNITVVDEDADGRESAALVANFGREHAKVRLVFTAPRGERSMLEWGEVWLEPTRELLELWKNTGGESEGVEQIGDGRFRIAGERPGSGRSSSSPGSSRRWGCASCRRPRPASGPASSPSTCGSWMPVATSPSVGSGSWPSCGRTGAGWFSTCRSSATTASAGSRPAATRAPARVGASATAAPAADPSTQTTTDFVRLDDGFRADPAKKPQASRTKSGAWEGRTIAG